MPFTSRADQGGGRRDRLWVDGGVVAADPLGRASRGPDPGRRHVGPRAGGGRPGAARGRRQDLTSPRSGFGDVRGSAPDRGPRVCKRHPRQRQPARPSYAVRPQCGGRDQGRADELGGRGGRWCGRRAAADSGRRVFILRRDTPGLRGDPPTPAGPGRAGRLAGRDRDGAAALRRGHAERRADLARRSDRDPARCPEDRERAGQPARDRRSRCEPVPRLGERLRRPLFHR